MFGVLRAIKLLRSKQVVEEDSHEEEEEDWSKYIKPKKEIPIPEGNKNHLTPVIFWEPGPWIYNVPITPESLNAHAKDFKTRTVEGSFVYQPGVGDIYKSAGNHKMILTFVPEKKHKYHSVTRTYDVVVEKKKPEITWDFPYRESMLFGTELDDEAFKGLKCEIKGGRFNCSHRKGMLLPVGIHTITVEYEPSAKESKNYARGYCSITFPVIGLETPLHWTIPFSAECFGHFAKHIEAMIESNTSVAVGEDIAANDAIASAATAAQSLSPGAEVAADENARTAANDETDLTMKSVNFSPASGNAKKAFVIDTAKDHHYRSPHRRQITPDCVATADIVVHTLPTGRRNSAFFAGAPIIYPDPLPSWLFEAQASFFNPETQEAEYVEGVFEYDPPMGTVLPAGTYTIHLTFTPNNLAKFRVNKASKKITVLPSPVPLDWPTPVGITDGEVIHERVLNCTNTLGIPGKYTYDPPLGTALPEGQYVLNVLFEPEDSHNYHAARTSTTFKVRHKRVPKLYWADPVDIAHPWPLSKLQLDAACKGGGFYKGKFVYEPTFGTVLDAGVHTLKVTFYPEQPTVQVVSASVQITVHQGMSRLIWNTPEPLYDGQGLYDDTLNCVCSNLKGGKFEYDPPHGTIVKAGPLKINVKYTPDNPNYAEANTYVKFVVGPKPASFVSKYYNAQM